ncbi:MAG: type II toxin-antitoxin system HigB family toxin [FCB group bacterium]|jgi:mRNA interferase HigB|nr:type II toxin-antitoxin system HigB family toxin [FCB group bacterium]
MRVIARTALRAFWEREPKAKGALEAWYAEAKAADWGTPAQVKAKYRSASILKNNRVVFNIGGNSYRLVVAVNYSVRIVYIRFVGTHAEYDAINAESI